MTVLALLAAAFLGGLVGGACWPLIVPRVWLESVAHETARAVLHVLAALEQEAAAQLRRRRRA